ncbi:methyl-accepting chemotaxis protein [Azohydromonas caseinilytica]|uniref:Methyl-accepting chemotaxis protein n=1 Tax=Azohydromonas caseinilytica TaxID=2728836 RepID=A0A848F716_9BURK|nr:methyl-accepting chemotaxis protein [Azohydromonas caseinilytica]NML15152.1 methyl-accepting chemotaxis protein [Azohydromonas caseinilytica]
MKLRRLIKSRAEAARPAWAGSGDSTLAAESLAGAAGLTLDMNAAAPGGSAAGAERPWPGPADEAAAAAGQSGRGRVARRSRRSGSQALARRQRLLATLLALGVVALVAGTLLALQRAERGAAQVAASGQALMQSQRLAKSVTQALAGQPAAFVEVEDSADVLARNLRGLRGGTGMTPAPEELQPKVAQLLLLAEIAEKNARTVLAQQSRLTQAAQALQVLNALSARLLESAEAVAALELQREAAPAQVAVAGRLMMLTQRIPRSAFEFLRADEMRHEALQRLGQDLDTFRTLAQGLLDGDPAQRLVPARDPATRERLTELLDLYGRTRREAGVILEQLQPLAAARAARQEILADSEPLRRGLESLQHQLEREAGFGGLAELLMLLGTLAALGGGAGLVRVYVHDQAQRAMLAEARRRDAEARRREEERRNEATQSAILRLMNELQAVAGGDLTRQATVSEDDVTGAIADSINYTIEELRRLVAQVQDTAARVTATTQQVEQTSAALLDASTAQLREIRDTGESVLAMAGHIHEVSAQAQHTAEVAQASLQAADRGQAAVHDSIRGMEAIRHQIQDSAKRLKRLGESSQEIGEITELISDITEQTNVLALNAAIQAASAGEAGRGFSVVAQEVQRLAERSADATRQIATLVRAIQADTQDAVAAMERTTQGVVQGTRLTDAAGAALGDIDRVSRELSEHIGRISGQALSQAQLASVVATNIQHIFAVTEQAEAGTRSTAQRVQELARSAEALRQSVTRFKLH